MIPVDSFDRIYSRILDGTQSRTQVELAACMGVTQSSISDAVRRRNIPPLWYLKLLDRFALSPDWLRWGMPPTHWPHAEGAAPDRGYGPDSAGGSGSDGRESGDGAVWTVLYASDCGGASDPGRNDLVRAGRVALPRSWTPENSLAVRLENGAGEPSIRKGALVGVDTADRRPRGGELYALLLPYEGFSLRRVFFEVEGPGLMLKADNPSFPVVRLTMKEGVARVLGRIWWVWQKL